MAERLTEAKANDEVILSHLKGREMSETGKIESNSTGREADWLHDRTEVTLTVQDVANRLHRDIYGTQAREHSAFHSCSCFLQARWFLGLDEKPKLYWPDGKGGNAHEPSSNPYVEILRLRDAVVEAAKVWMQTDPDEENLKWGTQYMAMCDAIKALLQFEQEHKS